jgi:hypothetical protein
MFVSGGKTYLCRTCYLVLAEEVFSLAQSISHTRGNCYTLAKTNDLERDKLVSQNVREAILHAIDPSETQSSVLIPLAIPSRMANRMITANMKATMRKYNAISIIGAWLSAVTGECVCGAAEAIVDVVR